MRNSSRSSKTFRTDNSKGSLGSTSNYAEGYQARTSRQHAGSRMGGSQLRGSRLGGTAAQGAADHRVFDEEGKERTPKPMLSLRANAMRPLPSLLNESQGSVGSETDRTSMISEMGHLERLSSAAFSTGSSRMSGGYASSTLTPELSLGSQMGNAIAGSALETKVSKQLSGQAVQRAGPPPVEKPPMLTAADLEKPVCIRLEETDTIWLLCLPGGCINADTEQGKAVEQANNKYKALLAQREGSDSFVDGEAQTVEHLQKAKEVQCNTTSTESTEVQTSTWDIHDSMYSDELPGEGQEAVAGPARAAAPIRSSSGMSDAGGRQSGSIVRGSGSMMSGQVSLAEDTGSNRASLMGSNRGSMAGWGATDSIRGSTEGYRSSMSSHVPSGMTGIGSSMPGAGMFAGSTRSTAEDAVPVIVDPISKVAGLLDALKLMDCAVQQNIYHDKLLMYRNVRMPQKPDQAAATQQVVAGKEAEQAEAGPATSAQQESAEPATQQAAGILFISSHMDQTCNKAAEGESNVEEEVQDSEERAEGISSVEAREPRLELLWEWECPLSPSLDAPPPKVTCMAWNKVHAPGVRQDILAVGYGQFEFGSPLPGLVALWSLKNPGYPLWSFTTSSGVTALDFSAHNPNMLAVGLYNGTLAVHDVKARQEVPSVSSSAGSGQHSDPVWQVCWVDRGLEQEERLVTISTDGRVTQWATTKGLEHTDLIKLKRTVSKQKTSAAAAAAMRNIKGEAFISRRSSGMSFDFNKRDGRIYIAGTEDGHIYKCSTSYSEQYLETYSGHLGPVYSVQWSPFQSNLFISSSADWSVKLWTEGKENALLTFQSANDEVNDVQWCPTNSTVFGTATSGGKVEIWDLAVSTLKPVAQHSCDRIKFACMLFCEESPVVVAGGSNGGVQVLRLTDVELADYLESVQTKRLNDAMRANIVKTGVVNVH